MKGLSKSQRSSAITLAVFLAGFAICFFLGRSILIGLTYTRRTQPVDFSHVTHGENVGIECSTCHFFYQDGSWSGIPTIEVCAQCHSEVVGETAADEKLVTEYVKKNKEVEWGLYFRQPQCVSFSHSSHVRMAKLACETCHGPQGLSRHPTEYLTNQITKYSYVVYGSEVPLDRASIIGGKGDGVWGTMAMNQCVECHQTRGTSTACFICHR